MQKFLLSLLVGFFAPIGRPALTPAALQPAALIAAQDGPDQRALAMPPAPLETVQAARASVKHEVVPAEGERVHRFTFMDGTVVEFNDRTRRPRDQARRERVVQFFGTPAAEEPATIFQAAGKEAGLTPPSIEALRFVSRHEGGFDAINTWDRARFSWGFIQFAGGRGLRPALAHFKARSPELFHGLMAKYGVDVLPGANGRPEPAFLDPKSGQLLRGNDAEQAYGDDPLAIALFIRAGRVPEVKQRQVEAAIRDYALPALMDDHQSVRLSDALRSPQGLAMLIDRKVHEGNVRRLGWALEHASLISGVRNPAEWPRLEGMAMDLAIRDADARSNVAELGEAAATLIDRAAEGARKGEMAYVPDGPSLTAARAALEKLVYEADYRMVVGNRRDEVHNGGAALLAACTADRMRALSGTDAATELDRAAAAARELVSGLKFEYAIRNRLKDIRDSQLAGPPRAELDYP